MTWPPLGPETLHGSRSVGTSEPSVETRDAPGCPKACHTRIELPTEVLSSPWIAAGSAPEKGIEDLPLRVLVLSRALQVHANTNHALASQVDDMQCTVSVDTLNDTDMGEGIIESSVSVSVVGVVPENRVPLTR